MSSMQGLRTPSEPGLVERPRLKSISLLKQGIPRRMIELKQKAVASGAADGECRAAFCRPNLKVWISQDPDSEDSGETIDRCRIGIVCVPL